MLLHQNEQYLLEKLLLRDCNQYNDTRILYSSQGVSKEYFYSKVLK